MDKTQSERLIAAHVQPIFGFALKRCRNVQDAEDVAQEIALRAFHGLLRQEDVADPVRYIWMVAHNVLANHYRERARFSIGIPDSASVETDHESVLIQVEATVRLRQEIARLGRLQREILVAHYFHGQKQTEIAATLNIPLGTVKWHLFEAKKELKKSMETTRNMADLQFDPIRFTSFGTEGSIGTKGNPAQIFRSVLNQNIIYATWREACSINEIADALGVSPVYLEDALEQLTEQGYLTERHGRYRCALLLTEYTGELVDLFDRMHAEAAKHIAPALHAALVKSDVWSVSDLYTGEKPDEGGAYAQNFALWALLPWCIANSPAEKTIPFEDVATLRADGGRNIVHAGFAQPGTRDPALYADMDAQFSGPCWNECDGLRLWQMDSIWSDKRIGDSYPQTRQMTLNLLKRFYASDTLTDAEYAYLTEQGLLRTNWDEQGCFYVTLTCVWLRSRDIREKLLGIVRDVYTEHHDALEALRKPYADALLACTPAHLRKVRQYMLQNVFQSDWFIQHCLSLLVKDGLLTPPTDEERRSLHTIILSE